MDAYLLLVFTHVLGGVGLLSALGVEITAYGRSRRSETLREARSWLSIARDAVRFESVAMVLTVGVGVWMMIARWGPEPWIVTALVAILAMALLTAVVTRSGLKRLAGRLADGPVDTQSSDVMRVERRLSNSVWVRAAIGVGILGLMTIKPSQIGSAAIITAAVVVGLALALRLRDDARDIRSIPKRSESGT